MLWKGTTRYVGDLQLLSFPSLHSSENEVGNKKTQALNCDMSKEENETQGTMTVAHICVSA